MKVSFTLGVSKWRLMKTFNSLTPSVNWTKSLTNRIRFLLKHTQECMPFPLFPFGTSMYNGTPWLFSPHCVSYVNEMYPFEVLSFFLSPQGYITLSHDCSPSEHPSLIIAEDVSPRLVLSFGSNKTVFIWRRFSIFISTGMKEATQLHPYKY